MLLFHATLFAADHAVAVSPAAAAAASAAYFSVVLCVPDVLCCTPSTTNSGMTQELVAK